MPPSQDTREITIETPSGNTVTFERPSFSFSTELSNVAAPFATDEMPRYTTREMAVEVYRTATDKLPDDQIVDALEESTAVLLQVLLYQLESDMRVMMDRDQEYASAFREATGGIPRPISVEFADYLLRETEVIPEDDNYDFEQFVEDFSSRYTSPRDDPIEIDTDEISSPLTFPERRLIVGQLAGLDMTLDEAEQINDHQEFVERATSYDSVEDAIRHCEYSSAIPDHIIDDLAPPEDWPEDLNPASLTRRQCSRCSSNYEVVYTEDGGRQFLHGPDLIGVHHTGAEADIHSISGDNIICDVCIDHMDTDGTIVGLITEDGCGVGISMGVAYVDEGEQPLSELPDEQVAAAVRNHSDMVEMSEDEMDVNVTAVLDAIQEGAQFTTDSGFIAIRNEGMIDGGGVKIRMDPTEFGSVKMAKDIAAGRVEVDV